MKLKSIVAAALVAASGAAFADGTLGTLNEDGASFWEGVTAGGFVDFWTFTLPTLSNVSGGGFYSPRVAGVGVSLLFNGNPTGLSDSNIQDGFAFSNLAAGNYTLTFGGFSSGVGSYGGNVAAIPVPEPETYAMMLAGLAALGFMARRRA